ncbi:helix-turn-helix domain-containing protein [Streptomyces sp. NBC_01142]|uniref:helix-turn-helix domain-containing protein n=1 Tax=Streptomyces sp. NBC_01142 TaxID=2975865 RepID=UPI0022527F9F|nr:helix-turn-helix domain-containing protein [Streptomyces sp. NBC_01142]MCX4826415.1 helix-turn-helix domain-containing protein [Streptomyces sp. NBC_01142]
MTTSSLGPVSPSSPEEVTRYQVVRRLTRAAAHSDAQLIAEAAALSDGWAVLADHMGRLVCSAPDTAGPEGVRAAAHPQVHPHLTIRKMTGAVLVIGPGSTAPASRTDLIARTTVDLLRMRARVRRAEETHQAEQRLHTAVLHLLLSCQPHLATDVLGGPAVTHATVFRLTGQSVQIAQQALLRATQPSVSLSNTRMLVCVEGQELVVVALHGIGDDHHCALPLVRRIAEQHQLTAGVSGPVPLDMVATAWTEAGSARHSSAGGCLTSATGMGAHGLLRVVPEHRLAAWSASILQPLDREQHRTLEASLRSGSAQAAASVLDVSEGTVRTRLRGISTLLATELDHPTVQAQLLLAVRAPATPVQICSSARLVPDPPLPTDLLSPDQAHRWASARLKPLDKPQRIALRCWLQHRGRTAPAASELNLSRSTLTDWLTKCGKALRLDLSSATVRAELHLAAETIATPDDTPTQLPRRGGRTYRGQRT